MSGQISPGRRKEPREQNHRVQSLRFGNSIVGQFALVAASTRPAQPQFSPFGGRHRFLVRCETYSIGSMGQAMDSLSLVCDLPGKAQSVRRQLEGVFAALIFPVHRIRQAGPPGPFTVVNIDLGDPAQISDTRDWLEQRPKDAKVVFVTRKSSRHDALQAYAIGATDLVHPPFDGKSLLRKLYGDFESLAGTPSDFSIEGSPGVAAAFEALQSVFSSASLGGALDQVAIDAAGEAIVRQIESTSLASWIEVVRKHHSQTYQHSLLVTGVVVAFGRQLGLCHADLKRLSFAGILHDIGKARVPVVILEKPGPLDLKEANVMMQHPLFGMDALRTAPGLPADIADTVVHHHEYLDGSGYPHGLSGGEIADLVRTLTIADIFSALIERRSYKPPLSGEKAYEVLLDMGPKLDKDLVREFRGISRITIEAAKELSRARA
jgi:putative nucleotidyltransferase with HDIG domain